MKQQFLPYSKEDRSKNLERAIKLSEKILPEVTENLRNRLDEVRNGVCSLLHPKPPSHYQSAADDLRNEQLEELRDYPELLMRWQNKIHLLCEILPILDSERMDRWSDQVIERVMHYHASSPFLELDGLNFHFNNVAVNIDDFFPNSLIPVVVSHFNTTSPLPVNEDQPLSFSLKKMTVDGMMGAHILVTFTRTGMDPETYHLPMNHLTSLTTDDLRGTLVEFIDALEMCFGINMATERGAKDHDEGK